MAARVAVVAAVNVAQGTPENLLRVTAYRSALLMLLDHPGFGNINTHLTVQEKRDLRANPTIWPGTKPVFSPYATTKPTAFYTQVKPAGDKFTDNTRHSVCVHRMTARFAWGQQPQIGFQASHRLGTGTVVGIERDFNPNNLCWEGDRINKSRSFCQLYFESQMFMASVQVLALTLLQQFTQSQQRTHNVCTVVHAHDMQPGDNAVNFLCNFWDPAWGAVPAAVALHSSA